MNCGKFNPDFAIKKACLMSLFSTTIKASFFDFPFATKQSYKALQDLLYLQALKLHINK